MKIINGYFLEKSDKVSFIELKKGSHVNVNDYIIEDYIPLPMITTTLVEEIREGSVEEEFKVSHLIEGVIYTLGMDIDFKYKEEYKEILYNYNSKIEEYILYKGLKFIEEENNDDGCIYFRALININPENIDGMFNYSLCLENISKEFINKGNEKKGRTFLLESTRYLESILELAPEFTLAHYKLGYHYKFFNQFLKSKLTWKKFIETSRETSLIEEVREELEKINDDVAFEKGLAYLSHNEYDSALDIFLKLSNTYKKSWDAFYLTGLSYKGLGEYQNAIDSFIKAIEIDGDESEAYNELGISLVGIGNMKEAIRIFSEGIKLNAKDSKILFNRGMTYLELGLFKDAKVDVKASYELEPENTLIKKQLEQLEKLGEDI